MKGVDNRAKERVLAIARECTCVFKNKFLIFVDERLVLCGREKHWNGTGARSSGCGFDREARGNLKILWW